MKNSWDLWGRSGGLGSKLSKEAPTLGASVSEGTQGLVSFGRTTKHIKLLLWEGTSSIAEVKMSMRMILKGSREKPQGAKRKKENPFSSSSFVTSLEHPALMEPYRESAGKVEMQFVEFPPSQL